MQLLALWDRPPFIGLNSSDKNYRVMGASSLVSMELTLYTSPPLRLSHMLDKETGPERWSWAQGHWPASTQVSIASPRTPPPRRH
jgi:hypothetical protein